MLCLSIKNILDVFCSFICQVSHLNPKKGLILQKIVQCHFNHTRWSSSFTCIFSHSKVPFMLQDDMYILNCPFTYTGHHTNHKNGCSFMSIWWMYMILQYPYTCIGIYGHFSLVQQFNSKRVFQGVHPTKGKSFWRAVNTLKENIYISLNFSLKYLEVCK